MNPLTWKREHQIALACAIALGLFVGVIAGLRIVDYGNYSSWYFWCVHRGLQHCTYGYSWYPGYWLLVGVWGVIGGLIAAALVYIWQLLRA